MSNLDSSNGKCLSALSRPYVVRSTKDQIRPYNVRGIHDIVVAAGINMCI